MKVGDIVRTPYDPTGIVQIVSIDLPTGNDPYGTTANVLYLHDHYGYPAGTKGMYQYEDLRPLGEVKDYELDRLWRAFKQSNDLQLAIAKFLISVKELETNGQ